MVMAQRVLNFFHHFDPLRARLPLPEHHKSHSAYTAMCLSISVGTLAQDLHFRKPPLPAP
jgi:hypothetical protein